MPGTLFRLVCTPATLDGAPEGWIATMLEEGELALLADDGGLTRSPPSRTSSTS